MTTGNAASRSRGAAPRSGANGKVKTVEFRGLKLHVPATAPGEVLFDIGDNDVTGTLRTLLGDNQLRQVREKVAGDKLSLDQTVSALTDLVNHLFTDTYGITPGE